MISTLNKLNSIFNDINYDNINAYSKKCIRNRINGISLQNAILFRFKYARKYETKESIANNINYTNNTNYDRTCYIKKEYNISASFFEQLSKQIYMICHEHIGKNANKIIAIDGTCSNNITQKVSLNMGYYDINTNLVLDLTNEGPENRNKEVKTLIKHIYANVNLYVNATIVGDRAYFSYELLKILIDNNINFVIRCKGNVTNLNIDTVIKTKNKSIIEHVRNNTKVVKYSEIYEKTIYSRHTKNKATEKRILDIKNDCILVTNLKDRTDDDLLKIYRSRWSIETFFKIIKENFKIQHTKEKNIKNEHITKIFCCTNIVMNLVTLFENYFHNNLKFKINRSNLICGIYNHLITKIIYGKLQMLDINKLANYANLIKNKDDRKFPRISKTPFSKWNIKSYSMHTEINKITNTILNNTVNDLHKNKKLIAQQIIAIKNAFGEILKVNNET